MSESVICGKPVGFGRCNRSYGHAGGCGFKVCIQRENERIERLSRDADIDAEVSEIDEQIAVLQRTRAKLMEGS